jgi:hypothetical protein
MPECRELLTEARESIARFTIAARSLLTGLRDVTVAAVRLMAMLDGFRAGYDARARNWSMPDEWHRGYLRGKLQGMRGRHGPAAVRG